VPASLGARAFSRQRRQFRHPEVRANWRASKDAAEAPGPSPFEGRFAATSG